MNMRQVTVTGLTLVLFLALGTQAKPRSGSGDKDKSEKKEIETGLVSTTFEVRNEMGSIPKLMKRYGYKPDRNENYEEYDIADEKFSVYLPEDYDPKTRYGLLVWMGHTRTREALELPEEWRPLLDERRLLWVAIERSGPSRLIWHRYALAIDAATNMVKRHKIDQKHIYIGGLRNGAKIAARIGVGLADMFRGAIVIGEVDFFRRVQRPSDARYRYSAAYTKPAGRTLGYARQRSRFVFAVEHDKDTDSRTMAVIKNGFGEMKFRNTHLLEIDSTYTPPIAETFAHMLDLLTTEEKKRK